MASRRPRRWFVAHEISKIMLLSTPSGRWSTARWQRKP